MDDRESVENELKLGSHHYRESRIENLLNRSFCPQKSYIEKILDICDQNPKVILFGSQITRTIFKERWWNGDDIDIMLLHGGMTADEFIEQVGLTEWKKVETMTKYSFMKPERLIELTYGKDKIQLVICSFVDVMTSMEHNDLTCCANWYSMGKIHSLYPNLTCMGVTFYTPAPGHTLNGSETSFRVKKYKKRGFLVIEIPRNKTIFSMFSKCGEDATYISANLIEAMEYLLKHRSKTASDLLMLWIGHRYTTKQISFAIDGFKEQISAYERLYKWISTNVTDLSQCHMINSSDVFQFFSHVNRPIFEICPRVNSRNYLQKVIKQLDGHRIKQLDDHRIIVPQIKSISIWIHQTQLVSRFNGMMNILFEMNEHLKPENMLTCYD